MSVCAKGRRIRRSKQPLFDRLVGVDAHRSGTARPGALAVLRSIASRRAGCPHCPQWTCDTPGYGVGAKRLLVTHREAKLILSMTQSATAATTPAPANTPATTTALNRITPNA
jgi:hypothetical protein